MIYCEWNEECELFLGLGSRRVEWLHRIAEDSSKVEDRKMAVIVTPKFYLEWSEDR